MVLSDGTASRDDATSTASGDAVIKNVLLGAENATLTGGWRNWSAVAG
jgi:hypothetical protein